MTGPCPCGGFSYDSCCGPLHRGEKTATTAEQLMRSRYSAYALGLEDYLLDTHQSRQSRARRRRDLQASLGKLDWQGLRILDRQDGGATDLSGTVTFEARYRYAGQLAVLRECSRFGRENNRPDGRWLYQEALQLTDSGVDG